MNVQRMHNTFGNSLGEWCFCLGWFSYYGKSL